MSVKSCGDCKNFKPSKRYEHIGTCTAKVPEWAWICGPTEFTVRNDGGIRDYGQRCRAYSPKRAKARKS